MEDKIFNSLWKYGREEMNVVQMEGELRWVIENVEKIDPKVILEIGVERGGSALFWNEILADKLDSLFIGVNFSNQLSWDIEKDGKAAKKYFIEGDSHKEETINKVKEKLGNREIDFLFIDGDHTYEGSLKDWENYKPLVRVGGIIGFHDVDMDGSGEAHVTKTWNSIVCDPSGGTFAKKKEKKNTGIGTGLIWI